MTVPRKLWALIKDDRDPRAPTRRGRWEWFFGAANFGEAFNGLILTAVVVGGLAAFVGSNHQLFPRMGWPGVIAFSVLFPIIAFVVMGVFGLLVAIAFTTILFPLDWLFSRGHAQRTVSDIVKGTHSTWDRWNRVALPLRRRVLAGLIGIAVVVYLTGPRAAVQYDPMSRDDCQGDDAAADCVPSTSGTGTFAFGIYLARPSVRLAEITDQHIWGFDACPTRGCGR